MSNPGPPSPLWRGKDETPTAGRSFDPTSWYGALVVMLCLAAVLWLVELLDHTADLDLDRRFGLRPRELEGLWGVATEPFLHATYGHLFSNTAPFVAIGWVLLLSGVRPWLAVTGIVVVVGGLLTWLTAPAGIIVGASGLVFGWLGYLLGRAYFSRRLKWIVTAVLVVFFFGTLLFSLLPSFDSNVSWHAHISGFVAGIAAAALLHARATDKPELPGPRPPAVS